MENNAPASASNSPKNSIKVLTFTPTWQRPEILSIMLKGLKRLKETAPADVEVHSFFTASESSTARLLLESGHNFIFCENLPLGKKKNQAIRYALDNFDFDYILEIGSDDLISSEYLNLVLPYLQIGTSQIHPEDVYFLDSITGKTAYWKPKNIIGLGRFIHRRALMRVLKKRKMIWEPERNRGLDSSSWRQLKIVGYDTKAVPTRGKIYTLDIKSNTNINPISHFTNTETDLAALVKIFPEITDILKKRPKL